MEGGLGADSSYVVQHFGVRRKALGETGEFRKPEQLSPPARDCSLQRQVVRKEVRDLPGVVGLSLPDNATPGLRSSWRP